VQIDQTALTFVLALVAAISVIFTVYNSFRNPQISSEKADIRFREEIDGLKKTVQEIKETHLRTVEQDIKNLTAAVNDLSKTVVRLSTIIDERIPRGPSTPSSTTIK
jgi:predicted PurR-regulated permease PerM